MYISVILAGGSGKRLWPISTDSKPKHLVKIFDKTLFEESVVRSIRISEKIIVLTNISQKNVIEKYLNRIKAKNNVKISEIFEPCSRNTAPAIMLASMFIERLYGKSNILVMPSDHKIETEKFIENVLIAEELCDQGYLVTFGIEPLSPETGYGYIEIGECLKNNKIFKVKKFIEKPSYEKSVAFIETKKYLWNSGIFAFNTQTIIEEFKKNAPDIYNTISKIKSKRDIKKFYPQVRDISIDYAVMEKSKKVCVVKSDFEWSDLGTFDSISKLLEKDERGNSKIGKGVFIDSDNSFIISNMKIPVVVLGLKEVAVGVSNEGIILLDMKRTQDVKNVYKFLQK